MEDSGHLKAPSPGGGSSWEQGRIRAHADNPNPFLVNLMFMEHAKRGLVLAVCLPRRLITK